VGLILSKAGGRADVVELSARTTGLPTIALVETASGVHRAYELATADVPLRLAFGSIDYAGDISACGDLALLLARSTIVAASRVGGLAAPIGGVSTALRDRGQVTADY
jgi:citrate lyase subunit beta / citryl-CoA lyase